MNRTRIRDAVERLKRAYRPATFGPTGEPERYDAGEVQTVIDILDREVAPPDDRPRPLLGRALTMELRRKINAVVGLVIDDETSDDTGFAVQDRRDEIGDGAVTWVDSLDSLKFLIKHGGQDHLGSPYNGSPFSNPNPVNS